MIEPTDEMVQAACQAALDNGTHLWRDTAKAITEAVLAIVERDHLISPVFCEEAHPDEPTTCERAHGHKGKHSGTFEKSVIW